MKLKDLREILKKLCKELELSEEAIAKILEGKFISMYIGEWKVKNSTSKAWQLKAYEKTEKGRKQLTLKTRTKNDVLAYEKMRKLVDLYTAYMHLLKAKEILNKHKNDFESLIKENSKSR